MNKKEMLNLVLRYSSILIIALFFSFSSFIPKLILKITIYPLNFLLSLFYDSNIFGSFIIVNSTSIELITACLAVSAYLLLIILNLITPMTKKQRLYSLIFTTLSLLVVNILRIFFLTILLINNFIYFDLIHKFFWYFLSIIFVLGLWFLSVYLFKIKAIPAYTDIKRLIKR
jgi:exosortase/archaeosortase family protein